MGTEITSADWKRLASDPQVRLRAIREYASSVLGDGRSAARWLERAHLSVRRGSCSIVSACESPEGFFEAMAELARIDQFETREALKRRIVWA